MRHHTFKGCRQAGRQVQRDAVKGLLTRGGALGSGLLGGLAGIKGREALALRRVLHEDQHHCRKEERHCARCK